jgi:hypothetical protein
VGDRVYNTDPDSPDSYWVCIEEGNPGVFAVGSGGGGPIVARGPNVIGSCIYDGTTDTLRAAYGFARHVKEAPGQYRFYIPGTYPNAIPMTSLNVASSNVAKARADVQVVGAETEVVVNVLTSSGSILDGVVNLTVVNSVENPAISGGGGSGIPIDAAVRILYDGTPSRIMGNIATVVPQGVEPGQYQVNFITPYADDEHYVVLLTTSNVNALATVGGYNPDNFLISCINPADGTAVASQINVVVINTPPV